MLVEKIRIFLVPQTNGGWWRAVGRINGREVLEDYPYMPSSETARADLITRYNPL